MNHISRKAQSAILLEMLDVPYAGSDPLARLMAGNKAYAKKIISEHLNTPLGVTIYNYSSIPSRLTFPVVIKPNREGSSIGITQESLCRSMQEVQRYSPDILDRFQEVLIEEYIEGYEITCFIIGNKGNYYLTEPVMCEYDGVKYFDDFVFGTEEKSSGNRKEYIAQQFLSRTEVNLIRQAAQTAFETLCMRDFARVDFRLQKNGSLFFIEINGNAVVSESSEIGVISKGLEIPFGKLVGNIILSATDRHLIIRD